MSIILFDTVRSHLQLFPLTLTRPVCDLRFGIFTAREWYAIASGKEVGSLSASYISTAASSSENPLCIDASVVPSDVLFEKIKLLQPGQVLEDENGIIAYVSPKQPVYDSLPLFFEKTIRTESAQRLTHPMDLVTGNARKIIADLTLFNSSGFTEIDKHSNRIFGSGSVFMQQGARLSGCNINTDEGPVFIGKDALIMEGTCIRGPVCISEGAVVKMGTQMYQGTTIGRHATAGGEIKNSLLGDYSNKAHHGYLGDSIIGRWCNLGAGTSNSNVKNNGGIIRMWSRMHNDFIPVGNKAGLIMGDYSKTAIHTAINTGTTIGICCSIHQAGITDKYIPSFRWGNSERYDFEKAIRDIQSWYHFKNVDAEPGIREILHHLYYVANPS